MPTVNYSFNLPTVGGSEDTWGADLNANWTALDTLLGGVSQTEFQILDGATITTEELNLLDGITQVGGAWVFPVFPLFESAASAQSLIVGTKVGNGNDAEIVLRKSRGGSGAATVIVAGDDLGTIRFQGYDGTAYVDAASIRADSTTATGDFDADLLYNAHRHRFTGIFDISTASSIVGLPTLPLSDWQAGASTTESLVTPAKMASAIGTQSPANRRISSASLNAVTGSRVLGGTYQNSTGSWLAVSVQCADNGLFLSAGPTAGSLASLASANQANNAVFGLIPPGWFYSATGSGLTLWRES